MWAADYLAFYQTAAFPRMSAGPCAGWRRCTATAPQLRRELIPAEPDHPQGERRATTGSSWARVEPLRRPDPSRRAAPDHLHPDHPGPAAGAEEVNDLWIKSSAQERLWAALKQADIEAERQYPLREDLPQYVADFALLCRDGKVAVIVDDEPRQRR